LKDDCAPSFGALIERQQYRATTRIHIARDSRVAIVANVHLSETDLAISRSNVAGRHAFMDDGAFELGRAEGIAGDAAKVKNMKAARAARKSVRQIAREFDTSVDSVQRLTV
jgi:hypothetical protein